MHAVHFIDLLMFVIASSSSLPLDGQNSLFNLKHNSFFTIFDKSYSFVNKQFNFSLTIVDISLNAFH